MNAPLNSSTMFQIHSEDLTELERILPEVQSRLMFGRTPDGEPLIDTRNRNRPDVFKTSFSYGCSHNGLSKLGRKNRARRSPKVIRGRHRCRLSKQSQVESQLSHQGTQQTRSEDKRSPLKWSGHCTENGIEPKIDPLQEELQARPSTRKRRQISGLQIYKVLLEIKTGVVVDIEPNAAAEHPAAGFHDATQSVLSKHEAGNLPFESKVQIFVIRTREFQHHVRFHGSSKPNTDREVRGQEIEGDVFFKLEQVFNFSRWPIGRHVLRKSSTVFVDRSPASSQGKLPDSRVFDQRCQKTRFPTMCEKYGKRFQGLTRNGFSFHLSLPRSVFTHFLGGVEGLSLIDCIDATPTNCVTLLTDVLVAHANGVIHTAYEANLFETRHQLIKSWPGAPVAMLLSKYFAEFPASHFSGHQRVQNREMQWGCLWNRHGELSRGVKRVRLGRMHEGGTN
ncbi:MAG: hypothetical protein AAGF84_03930 [Planctomycetota bacterium]